MLRSTSEPKLVRLELSDRDRAKFEMVLQVSCRSQLGGLLSRVFYLLLHIESQSTADLDLGLGRPQTTKKVERPDVFQYRTSHLQI